MGCTRIFGEKNGEKIIKGAHDTNTHAYKISQNKHTKTKGHNSETKKWKAAIIVRDSSS